jgi:hypothetical protein
MVQSVKEAITRIEAITELTGKVAYDHFSEAKQLPFAVYAYDFSTTGADDYNGVQMIEFSLELYSETRNFSLEEKFLKAFVDVVIDSDTEYINEERMYQTVFKFTFPQKLS